jgi:hypothetical protein
MRMSGLYQGELFHVASTVGVEGDEPPRHVPRSTWRDLFPEGRTICYEGDDPAQFCQDILREFGFDPSADAAWGKHGIGGDPEWDDPFGRDLWFHCPPEHLDAIYGTRRFPVGS